MSAAEPAVGPGTPGVVPAPPGGQVSLGRAILWILGAFLTVAVVGSTVGKFLFWETYDRTPRLEQEFSKALEDVEAAPDDADKRVALGWVYFRKGQYNEALAQYRQALEINDSHYGALYNLGLAYMSVEKFERAVSALERAVELAPQVSLPHYQLGVAFHRLGRLDDAVGELELAYKLKPGSVEIIHQIGLVYEEKGELERAVYQYESALGFDPQYRPAYEGLQRVRQVLSQ